jgi:hypothetical protein
MKFYKYVLLVLVFLFGLPMAAAEEVVPTEGTVVETMVSGGYLYMKLEGQDTWIATSPLPQPVSVGDKIEYTGGLEMGNFHSRSLGRTFENILFIQNVKLAGSGADAMHAEAMKSHSSSGMTLPKPVTVVAPAAGEIAVLKEGKTIADILSGSDQLKEQAVSLNAKVMKVSEGIMGKNWITLQDGTGTEPQNKLLVTSQELVTPGDIVIAQGILKTDVDLGSGYTYKVLLEEAKFSAGVQ